MSYQERNTVVSLGSFSLIFLYFLVRMVGMMTTGGLAEAQVFRLWLIVIVSGIGVTILGTIIAHIVYAIIETIKTQEEPTFVEDERDKLIKLRGDRFGYVITSIGTFGAMLSFALNQPALVMFSALIGAGLFGQIAGDIYRLYLYRRGF